LFSAGVRARRIDADAIHRWTILSSARIVFQARVALRAFVLIPIEECLSMNFLVSCSSRVCRPGLLLRRTGVLAVVCAASIALAAPEAYAQQGKGKKPTTFNVVPIMITSVTVSGGQLVANGLVGTEPFTAPITTTVSPAQQEGACPILNLSLAPIHLSLLGLNVDTSAICLDITAERGALLGDLLCAIANLLNGGVPLGDVLAGLDAQQLADLNAGLTQVLNQAVFIPLSNSEALQGATCEVLSLALGPLDLNLLGLRVELDDCMGGPVTLDITATEGGGLLGDLLCNLTNVLSGSGSNTAVLALLRNISSVVGSLLG
jgi:hypothetical protein